MARTNAVWLIFYAGHYYPMTQSTFFVPRMHTVPSAISMSTNLQPNNTRIKDMQVMRLQNAYVPRCGLTNTTNKSPLQVTGPATDRPESQAKVSAFRCDWLDNPIQEICLIFCEDLPFLWRLLDSCLRSGYTKSSSLPSNCRHSILLKLLCIVALPLDLARMIHRLMR